MSNKVIPSTAWFIPLIPLLLASAIYFGEHQSSTFLFINHLTQSFPDTLWAWLTFLGNGWGAFAFAFPLLLLAPRLLTSAIFAGALAAVASTVLKNIFSLPRPAGLLEMDSFHRVGGSLLHNAFPSGHTLTAFAVASSIYFACKKNKRTYVSLIFILAALVGISRNAVGAHWLTDVLGGAGFGLWCGMIGALLAYKVPAEKFTPRSPWPRLIAVGGIVAIYAHYTQIMDLELNLPLQYASIAIIFITLILFVRAQFAKTLNPLD
jgi:membrane-associated phospholipid phosphatase